MIKFVKTAKNGNTLVGLGLSEENIKRLKDGKPMLFSIEELGVEGVGITIVYGETEESIVADLKKQGVI